MLQVGDRIQGSRVAAAAVALAEGVKLAREVAPYVDEGVRTVKRAYQTLRDYSTVRYGPSAKSDLVIREKKKARRKAAKEVKKELFKDSDKKIMSNAVQVYRSFDRIGRKRRRTAKEIFTANIGRMSEVIFRWQRVSPSLLGPGLQEIAYARSGPEPPLSTGRVLPMHIMSLTNHVLFSSDLSFGCQRDGMHRITYDTSTKQFGYQKLYGQDNVSNTTSTEWQYENGTFRAVGTAQINASVFHKWTDIRFNLYGSGAMPLVYEIMVLSQMPAEMSIFDYSPGGTPIIEEANLNAFLRDQAKDYIGNPIIGTSVDRVDFKDKFKVLRRKIVRIDPLTYGDYKANIEGQAAGDFANIDITNIRNVNMFIRHDRFRNYAWTPSVTDEVLQAELNGTGFDKNHTQANSTNFALSDVDRDERLYLLIKCTAARSVSALADEFDIDTPAALPLTLDPNAIPPHIGSYDVVVRNCFRYDDSV